MEKVGMVLMMLFRQHLRNSMRMVNGVETFMVKTKRIG